MSVTRPVVVFPDVEEWAGTYLTAALAARTEACTFGVYVSNAVPPKRKDRMVIVRRDGGPRLGLALERPRLSVNVWGTKGGDGDASDLARLVAALLWSAPDGDPVCSVTQLSGPSPIADAQPRLLMLFELTIRGDQS